MCVSLQPGYLHKLLPDSAPTHPDSLEHLFDGEVFVWVLKF